jgi:AraC-like DNA-binding protein
MKTELFDRFGNTSSDDSNDFMIISLKDLFKNKTDLPFNIEKPHRSEYNLIMAFTEGFGDHIIDFKKYTFSKGSFLFISKEQTQNFIIKPGNDGYLIVFTDEYLNRGHIQKQTLSKTWLFNYHVEKPLIQINPLEQSHFFDLVKLIYKEFKKSYDQLTEEIIRNMLNLIILKAERIKRNDLYENQTLFRDDLFFRFKNLLENNYQESRNAKLYADKLDVSYKHLNNICKLNINKTAKSFIDDFLILEAKRDIISSDHTVKEISEKLGFDEPTNFVKYFKKHSRISPMRFKKKYLDI